MYWVIQNNLYNEYGYNKLMDVINRMGIPHRVVRVIPFTNYLIDFNFDIASYKGNIDDIPNIEIDTNQLIMTCGGTSLGRIAKVHKWFPGYFYNDNMDFSAWRDNWKTELFNYDAVVCKFKDVPKQQKDFFIRPTKDNKAFSGTVMSWDHFEKWQKDVMNDRLPQLNGDTEVMAASTKKIYTETRYFVVDGKIITASQYKIGSQVIYSSLIDDDNLKYAKSVIEQWQPDRAFVIDIADTPDGFKIMECNAINSAGFYDCDVSKIVLAIEDMKF